MNKLLNKLEYKFGRICIPNLMLYIVIAIGAAYIVNLCVPNIYLPYYMIFSRELRFAGEWWRIITWIFMPDDINPVCLILSLYFLNEFLTFLYFFIFSIFRCCCKAYLSFINQFF